MSENNKEILQILEACKIAYLLIVLIQHEEVLTGEQVMKAWFNSLQIQ